MSIGRRLAGIAALVLGAPAVLAALATPAAADTSLGVTTPADGRYQPGSNTPLLVTVGADRALTGTLEATVDGVTTSQRVEVPGGSTKQVVFLVPTPAYNSAGQLSFVTDGRVEKAVRLNLVPAGADELVAVLPSLAQGRDVPSTARLAVDVGVARLFRFDPALLAAGGDVLSPFSQLAAAPADLAQLSPDQLDGVRAWLSSAGGTLLVDAPAGTALPAGLTPVTPPGPADPRGAPIGLGRVRYTGGRAGAGAWDGLLAPTATHSPAELPFIGGVGAPDVGRVLAGDAGVRLLAIGSLLGVLIAYTALAGPVLWIVLRRTRRETALWVVLPGLALVTTLALYGFGRTLRTNSSSAHATVVADLPGSRIHWTEVLVSSPNGGADGVRLAPGWHPVPATTGFGGGFNGAQGQAGAGQRIEGSDLVTTVTPGGAGLVSAEQTGPAAAPSWSLDLRAQGDDLTGTITNRSDHRLEGILVLSGPAVVAVEGLDPGASAPLTLRGVGRPALNAEALGTLLFGQSIDGRRDDGVNASALVSWLDRRPALLAPGMVTVVGWTRQPASPLASVRGGTVSRGRTAFVTAVPAPLATDGTGQTELLRGTSTQVSDTPSAGSCGGEKGLAATARIRAGAGPGRSLVLDVDPRSVSALDLWDGAVWRPAGLAKAVPGPARFTVAVPPAAAADGSVIVRLALSCDAFGQQDPFPSLRAAVPGETVGQLGRPGGPGVVIGSDGTARG